MEGRLEEAYRRVEELEGQLSDAKRLIGQIPLPDGHILQVIDVRVAARLKALEPCLIVQHLAAERGEAARSAADLVSKDTNILGNAARRHFASGLDFA